MHYVLLAALAACLVPAAGQAPTGPSVRAERASLFNSHSDSQLFAQGMPSTVYKNRQPNPESNPQGDLA